MVRSRAKQIPPEERFFYEKNDETIVSLTDLVYIWVAIDELSRVYESYSGYFTAKQISSYIITAFPEREDIHQTREELFAKYNMITVAGIAATATNVFILTSSKGNSYVQIHRHDCVNPPHKKTLCAASRGGVWLEGLEDLTAADGGVLTVVRPTKIRDEYEPGTSDESDEEGETHKLAVGGSAAFTQSRFYGRRGSNKDESIRTSMIRHDESEDRNDEREKKNDESPSRKEAPFLDI